MIREARVSVAKALGGAALQHHIESTEAALEASFLDRVSAAVDEKMIAREEDLEARLEQLMNPIVEAYLRSATAGFGAAGGYDPTDQDFDAYMRSTGLFAILSACDDAIGNAAAAVPIRMVRNPDSDKPVVVKKHPLLELLKNPNPEQGHAQFWYAMQQQWGRTGNVYLSCVGKPDIAPWANPQEIWVLPSGRTKPVPNRSMRRAGKGESPISHYVYVSDSGELVTFLPSQILHIKRPHPTDPLVGLSPMKELELTLNQLFHAQSWNSGYFKNGAAPGLTFIRDGAALPTEEQRLRFEKKTDAETTGVKRVGKNLYLYGGWRVDKGGNTPQEAGFLQLIEVLTKHILAVKGVPPFSIGLLEHANWSNSVEQEGYLYSRAVIPFNRSMTDAMNTHPMVRVWSENGELVLQHDYAGIRALSPHKEQDASRAVSTYRGGITTRDESRAEIGKEAVGPERGGDEFFEQGSVLDDIVNQVRQNAMSTRALFVSMRDLAHELAATDKPRARATRWTAAQRRMKPFQVGTAKLMDTMFDAMRDQVLREIEGRSTGRLAVGEGSVDARWARDLFQPREYVDTYGPRLGAIAEATLKTGAEDLAEEALGKPIPFDVTTDAVQQFIDQRVAKSITTITENRLSEIEAIVTEAARDGRTVNELAAALRDHFDNNSIGWSQRIARTEIHSLYTEGGVQGLEEAGAETKQWLSAKGGNRRKGHQDADGQEVPIDADFKVEAEDGTVVTGRAPGQMGGGAAENANCTCTITVGGF